MQLRADGMAQVAVVGQDEGKSQRDSKTKTAAFIGLLLKGKCQVSFWKCFTFINLFPDFYSARGPFFISQCKKFLVLTKHHRVMLFIAFIVVHMQ